jgi:virulence-associated protein VapD
MTSLADAEDPELFDAGLRELESLRIEYEDLKDELERHRAEHPQGSK